MDKVAKGRAARIHGYAVFFNGDEFFFFVLKGVKEAQT
jgi:hypothetical protein